MFPIMCLNLFAMSDKEYICQLAYDSPVRAFLLS